MRTSTPGKQRSRQEKFVSGIALAVFFGSFGPLLAENMAFDNTVGSLRLVGIGVGVALLIGIPSAIVIRRLAFGSGDRWAACIFLVLGLCLACVSAATFVNHHFGAPPDSVALRVLGKEYHASTRKSGPQYWLKLRFGDRDTWIRVASADFEASTIGGDYTTQVQHGALGLPVIACGDCW